MHYPFQIRQDLGVCPQFNVLFEHLTVAEHLWFFASLKKTPAHKIREEVDSFIKNVGLQDKADSYAHQLSGMSRCQDVVCVCRESTIDQGLGAITY